MGAAALASPYFWPAVITAGSGIFQALSMPEGQELQSFEGKGALNPATALSDARGGIAEMIDLLKQRASQPVQLRSAYAQPLPVFTGGGLPMPIGVSGMDPALADPSLLSLPGVSIPGAGRHMNYPTLDGYGDPDYTPPRPGDGGTPGERPGPGGEPKHPGVVPMSNTPTAPRGPRRRNAVPSSASSDQSLFGAPNVSEYDDLDQGAGAVELLLRSMMPGTSRATTPGAF